MKKKVWVIMAVVLAVIALAFLVTGLVTRNLAADTAFPEDAALRLQTSETGTLTVSWPEVPDAERYRLEVFAADAEKPYLSVVTPETEYPVASEETAGTVRVTPLTGWYIGPFRRWKSGTPLETAVTPSVSDLTGFLWHVSENTHTVSASWQGGDADGFLLQAVYENGDVATAELDRNYLLLDFGDDCPVACPEYGTSCTLTVAPFRRNGSSVTRGAVSEALTFTEDDLYGTDLAISCVSSEQNSYTLTWQRTKGSAFTVSLDCEDGSTVTAEYAAGDELSLTTDRLLPFKNYTLTVTATGAMDPITEQYTFRTGAAALGCTIWPIQELPVYSAPDKESETLGKIAEVTPLRVLEETGDFFKVDTEFGIGYVRSAYCMINLPEYIGELCLYNITNSYAALYKMHTYGISGITDTVITGYENVLQADGSYLVPLLYPTAQKLIPAALALEEQGYTIRIYDAYRPRIATYSLYNHALAIMDCALPAYNYYGERVSVPGPSEDYEYTRYHDLVTTENGWSLNSFLGYGGSYHNMGIAMDMTLVDSATGEEITAQTEMHDLSIYSVTWYNTEGAKLMASVMKEAGFEGISSEWWHFQDTVSRKALNITNWCYSGVAAAPSENETA